MIWPIFVPSKGRPDSTTLRLLTGLPVRVVVEPQDRAAYAAAQPSVEQFVLPKSNQGIAFVRQWILDRADDWYWMLDDDITAFFRVEGKRCVKCPPAEALLAGQQAAVPTVGQVALEYQQFAWSSGGLPKFNSYADVCVGIHPRVRSAAKYRAAVALKEDRDFTMQIIRSGLDVVRCASHAFSAPKNGSNLGGLSPVYAEGGREKRAVDKLVELWPWCVASQVKKDGRLDAKINWKRIRG